MKFFLSSCEYIVRMLSLVLDIICQTSERFPFLEVPSWESETGDPWVLFDRG
jgi:hypothetical protein